MNDLLSFEVLKSPFFLIAGPCAVESESLCFQVAEQLVQITESLNIPYVFKASYRKANRSKVSSFTGIGDQKALTILGKVREQFQVPVTTDVHTEEEAKMAAEYVDILQIPAFLCRQTSLLQAAGATGRIVNIKKGQFMSPEAMEFAAKKIVDTGNNHIILTERGVTFGYHDLVVDYRSIPIMQKIGYPVVLDCTHSLQQPNQKKGVTGGTPEYIPTLAKAAVAIGVNGLFIETHPKPSEALSDGANMLALESMQPLLHQLNQIRAAIQ